MDPALQEEFRFDRAAYSVASSFEEAEAQTKRYWLAQTPQKRLRALEFMRQLAYGYDPHTARLQRVLAFAELP